MSAPHTCPQCGADHARACAVTSPNGETIDTCMWMPPPWTPFEDTRRAKFWAERFEDLRDDIRMH